MSDPDQDLDEEPTQFIDAFAPGSVFAGRFQLGEALGVGAMGKVLAARDLQTGKEVALKLLHKDRAKDPEVLERFRREAAILEAIGHPGIVRIYEVGAGPGAHPGAPPPGPGGSPWLSMELLRGETLKKRISRGPMDAMDIVPILNTLCDALAAAHLRGVVHRDLKPENVLLQDRGMVPCKILDFGLSRFATSKALTAKDTIIGTPRYMAPEQIRSSATADFRVDIFSVGILLYEMLTGRSPYAAEDLGQLLGCVLEGRVVPLRDLRPDLPDSVAAVIARAMARSPADRFQTPGAIAEAYANALGVSSGRSGLANEGIIKPSGATPVAIEGAEPLTDPFAPLALAPEPADPEDELAMNPLLRTIAPRKDPTPLRHAVPPAGAPPAPIAPPTGAASATNTGPRASMPGISGPAVAGAPAAMPGRLSPPPGEARDTPSRPSWTGGPPPAFTRRSAPVSQAQARAVARRGWSTSFGCAVFFVAVIVVAGIATVAALVLRAALMGQIHIPGISP